MIGKDTPLVIERIENGYLIRPFTPPNSLTDVYQTYVFNELGWASYGPNGETTLIKFIECHFTRGLMSEHHPIY